jgi:hypothetical protein
MPSSLIWFDHIPLNYAVMDNGFFSADLRTRFSHFFSSNSVATITVIIPDIFGYHIFWDLTFQPSVHASKVVLKKIQIPKHVGIPVKPDGVKKDLVELVAGSYFRGLKKATYFQTIARPLPDHFWTTADHFPDHC